MAKLKVLDCTLRDGGYINDFRFGAKEMADIVRKLSCAGLDVVECGFLQTAASDPDRSLFCSAQDVKRVIGEKNPNCMYVAMLQLGRFQVEELEPWDGMGIDGVRITFHEHEIDEAFRTGEIVKQLGYKVFIQPVGTNTFSEDGLLEVVRRVNRLRPYAFYLVDTLGSMYKSDLLRMLLRFDHDIDEGILLGFHSHNNLQLSFANSQELSELVTRRTLLLDASVFGMGRGAGNLCTELICHYINMTTGERYDMMPVLEVLDEYIHPIFRKTPWGYSAAYYLSSVNDCHPNYSTYFLDKQTISVRDIHAIIRAMDPKKRILFDRAYAEECYIRHLERKVDDKLALEGVRKLLAGRKTALLLAPGKSLANAGATLNSFIQTEQPCLISVNFVPDDIAVDFAFISNLRRYRAFAETGKPAKTVVTSNIVPEKDDCLVVNYSDYLNENAEISDNAGLMLMNLLIRLGVEKLALAGFDGYSVNPVENYFTDRMVSTAEDERLMSINRAVARRIAELRERVTVEFLTPSRYGGGER